jgi:protein-disulfide isomerase
VNTFLRMVALAGLCASTVVSGGAWAADAKPAFDESQSRQIEEIVRSYLMQNPEVLVEALTAYQQARQKTEAAGTAQALADFRATVDKDTRLPIAGNPKGDVTIVEFFDYRCGYCKRVTPAVQELLDSDANVRFVFMEFPILGPQSVVASKAAQAAWTIAPERHRDFHVALMKTRQDLTEDHVLDIAEETGIDRGRLATAMTAPDITETIRRNVEIGEAIGVQGTPAFMIDGKLVPGAIDLATMRQMVADARSG